MAKVLVCHLFAATEYSNVYINKLQGRIVASSCLGRMKKTSFRHCLENEQIHTFQGHLSRTRCIFLHSWKVSNIGSEVLFIETYLTNLLSVLCLPTVLPTMEKPLILKKCSLRCRNLLQLKVGCMSLVCMSDCKAPEYNLEVSYMVRSSVC